MDSHSFLYEKSLSKKLSLLFLEENLEKKNMNKKS